MQQPLTVTVEARYVVCINGLPVGRMWDQFEAGELRQPFPFKKIQNSFTDEFEADSVAQQLREHIACIEMLPEKAKKGRSAETWRLHENDKAKLRPGT